MAAPVAAIVLAAVMTSGCAAVDQVVEPAAGAVARGIDEACARGTTLLAIEARKGVVAEINSRTEVGNHTPSDCDGDGLPDFAIDAEGMPVLAP